MGSWDLKIGNKDGQAFSALEHDIVLDKVGRSIKLRGKDKLIQAIQKILFTETNNFFSQYKTDLQSLIGSNLGIDETINILAQRITDALVYLQILQEQQVRYQTCEASELIKTISEINVNYLPDLTGQEVDVLTFTVAIVIISQDLNTITVSRDLQVL